MHRRAALRLIRHLVGLCAVSGCSDPPADDPCLESCTWELPSEANVAGLAVGPDGGVFLYGFGQAPDLDPATWTRGDWPSDPAFIAKLTASGEVEWVVPIPQPAHVDPYASVAAGPSGGVAYRLPSDAGVRAVFVTDGQPAWDHDIPGVPDLTVAYWPFRFDALGRLWVDGETRIDANGVEAGVAPTVLSVGAHLVALEVGPTIHLRSYEFDGTTVRFDRSAASKCHAEEVGLGSCVLQAVATELANGTVAVSWANKTTGVLESDPRSTVDWGCAEAYATGMAAIDATGACLWIQPYDEDTEPTPDWTMQASGNDVLAFRGPNSARELQLLNGADGTVIERWSGVSTTAGSAANQAIYAGRFDRPLVRLR